MAESNKTILTLGALIIAGVALFFIGSYIGNAVFSKRPALTTAQKTEVLNMLNKCQLEDVSSDIGDSGSSECKDRGKTCIVNFITAMPKGGSSEIVFPIDCNMQIGIETKASDMYAYCCQP